MMKLEGVAAFVAVAEAGSISDAARRLGLAKSVVSELLAELERSLGARLLQRTTRKTSLTEGRLGLSGARPPHRSRSRRRRRRDGRAARRARRAATDFRPGELRSPAPGRGALSVPGDPRIELSLDLDDRFVDVAADGYDAVIRHGPIGDNRLVAKRLAASRRVLAASPAYLAAHGAPRSLAELSGRRAILYANRETDWRFSGPTGAVAVRPLVGLRVNNGIVMREAALAGLGITLLASFVIGADLASGALRAIDVGLEPEGADVYLAYPRDRTPSAKIAAVVEALRRAFGDPPRWDTSLAKITAGRS